jgi:hypothetical protein
LHQAGYYYYTVVHALPDASADRNKSTRDANDPENKKARSFRFGPLGDVNF